MTAKPGPVRGARLMLSSAADKARWGCKDHSTDQNTNEGNVTLVPW